MREQFPLRGESAWGIAFGQQLEHPSHLTYVPLDTTRPPIELFESIYQTYENAFILESVEGPRRLARYSLIGFDPGMLVRAVDGRAEIAALDQNRRTLSHYDDPLALLNGLLPKLAPGTASYGRYTGGLVGYASYELVHSMERVHHTSKKKEFPDLEFGLFLDGIVYDHLEKRAFYFHHGLDRSQTVKKLAKPNVPLQSPSFGQPKSTISEGKFCEEVERTKEYIASGDILQAVLSKQYKIQFRGSLLPLYRALRKINPSPYMYHLKFGSREIVGSSPEMLGRKVGRRIENFPIAGTRPFASDPARNRMLANELLHDEKERAEHVMLVDLARNDIGRVSEYGTVNVPELMKVQAYSHVQHIVSRVVGRLRKGLTSFDLFRSIFPAGTVSGAPKVRAMEIIDELERTPRGPYAGAVGYFSTNGNADFAITIRTLFANQSHCYIQSGAGIVADSNPQKEWIETEQKLAALFAAIQQSQGGLVN